MDIVCMPQSRRYVKFVRRRFVLDMGKAIVYATGAALRDRNGARSEFSVSCFTPLSAQLGHVCNI